MCRQWLTATTGAVALYLALRLPPAPSAFSRPFMSLPATKKGEQRVAAPPPLALPRPRPPSVSAFFSPPFWRFRFLSTAPHSVAHWRRSAPSSPTERPARDSPLCFFMYLLYLL